MNKIIMVAAIACSAMFSTTAFATDNVCPPGEEEVTFTVDTHKDNVPHPTKKNGLWAHYPANGGGGVSISTLNSSTTKTECAPIDN